MSEEKKEQQGEQEQSTKEEEVKEVEVKVEEKTEKKPQVETKPELTGKFKDLIKQIEELSVLELVELVKELEERFGVSAAAPVAIAAGAAPSAGGEAAAEAEEKSEFTIHLASAGAQKIAVIKAIREIKPELGLKEAKDLVDGAPKDVKAGVPKEEAEEAKKKLEAAGATVELK